FQTAFGTGLVLTSLALPRLERLLGDRLVSVRGLAIAVSVSGLAAATYVGTHSLVVAFVGVFVWGADVAFFLPPMQTLLQRYTPGYAHGRVLALASAADGVGNLVTIPLAGVVVGAVGVSLTGAIVGAAAVVVGAGAWLSAPRPGRGAGPVLRSGRWRAARPGDVPEPVLRAPDLTDA
ncbi:MAG: MFS transporter, partial [Actinomycetes bacterium]